METSHVAIVTGGASGLGAAICKVLLSNGYKVCVSDIQDQNGNKFVDELQTNYGSDQVLFIRCDVTQENDYKRLFDSTLDAFGKIDVVCNNAGIILERDPLEVLKVNLLGPIFGCQTAVKYLGKSNGGRGGIVINTSSIGGFIPESELPAYVASKHALVGLTRSYGLPYHYDKDGIIFAALCPSVTDTPLQDTIRANSLAPMLENTKRIEKMDPIYVAKGVLKILEDRINGSTLLVTPARGYQYIGYQAEFKNIVFE